MVKTKKIHQRIEKQSLGFFRCIKSITVDSRFFFVCMCVWCLLSHWRSLLHFLSQTRVPSSFCSNTLVGLRFNSIFILFQPTKPKTPNRLQHQHVVNVCWQHRCTLEHTIMQHYSTVCRTSNFAGITLAK